MTQVCDALRVLAELETVIEKQNCKVGHIDYGFVKHTLAELTHIIQTKQELSVNDLKKDLDLYHN